MARGLTEECVVTRVTGGIGPESVSWRRWCDVYRDGVTVAELLAAGLTRADIQYDMKCGYVRATGPLAFDPYVRMYHRKSTDHLDMIWEARRTWAAAAPLESDLVLDLGAHVGGFAVWAARECCARMVVAVEPAPDTCAVLRLNAEGLTNLRVMEVACVAGPEKSVDLYLTRNHENNGSCMASVIRHSGRRSVRVDAARFGDLMTELRPEVLKIDVEGAEMTYPLLDASLMSSVRVLAAELHVRGDGGEQKKLVLSLEKQGFRLLTGEKVLLPRPLEFGSRWAVNGVWRRRNQ